MVKYTVVAKLEIRVYCSSFGFIGAHDIVECVKMSFWVFIMLVYFLVNFIIFQTYHGLCIEMYLSPWSWRVHVWCECGLQQRQPHLQHIKDLWIQLWLIWMDCLISPSLLFCKLFIHCRFGHSIRYYWIYFNNF